MKTLIILIGIFLSLSTGVKDDPQNDFGTQPKIHEIIVEEIIQTSNYTYLLVREGDTEYWIADIEGFEQG